MTDAFWPALLDRHEAEIEADCVPIVAPDTAPELIRRARAALHRAGDCDRHLMARALVSDAADALHAAAAYAPAHGTALMRLSADLNDALQCWPWPDMAAAERAMEAAAAVAAAIGKHVGEGTDAR